MYAHLPPEATISRDILEMRSYLELSAKFGEQREGRKGGKAHNVFACLLSIQVSPPSISPNLPHNHFPNHPSTQHYPAVA